METRVLGNPEVYPSEAVLKQVLGNSFVAYAAMIKAISAEEFKLTTEWRFYKDGQQWLCKVSAKKKTVFWISVWEAYFKAGFYFSEKTRLGVEELAINEAIKVNFRETTAIGKLFPLVMDISREEQIADLMKIVDYKRRLK